ncbi:stage II sporulation protein M [Flaviaesturariibacter flavus]|uniref:Stage II sporulation protein M n=1 Tax=Flaviaesturariibacter flavus TaxID=2502780 RepID=A0A4R1BHB5_9BACT|nr:stage II sporulation protein M [Flaviaesturariibacter flavus]TCJ16564.1 stage II sporulation protein M [Flaviaesturariibacter flavus]
MREGLFIKKNKDHWEQIEHDRTANADETASHFTRLVNDLGYAKTFYPTSKITAYLNALASRIYLNIYQNRKDPSNRLALFVKRDVPLAIARHYRVLLFALGVFLVFFSVGFFSAMQEKSFVRQMLGDAYVDMTEKNIAAGNPFDVYGDTSPFLMWIMIMLNNIQVSLHYFGEGILLGIPSIIALGRESVRIGAFEYMFYQHGLGFNWLVSVMLHGTLEITAIIMTCGAGAILGTSFLFPGTQRRLTAFREGGKDAIKIVLALIPVFMVAAFIEGFITRHYKMPLYASGSILLASLLFVIGYFVIYPIRVWRQVRKEEAAHA